MIRTFIALTLSDDVGDYLNSIVSSFIRAGVKASWTKPGNFHLTLKFLGDISENLVPELSKKLSEIDTSFPQKFELTELSGFPNLKNPRVLWIGINDEISKKLVINVQQICESLGFESDKKPFKAHLTLGRIKNQAPSGLEDIISKIPEYNESCFFTGLALIKSELTKKGPIYTNLWIKD